MTGDTAIARASMGGTVTNNGSIPVLDAEGGMATNNGTGIVAQVGGGTLLNTATGTFEDAFPDGGTLINDGYIGGFISAYGQTGSTYSAANAVIAGTGTFGSGAELGGNFSGDSTIFAPGDGATAGTLTIDGLDIAGFTQLNYLLGQPLAGGSVGNDLLDINGPLLCDTGSDLTFDITPGADFGAGTYDLIEYESLMNNSSYLADWSASLVGGNGNYDLSLQFNPSTDQLDLVVVAVPEPASAGMLALGTAALLVRRRRVIANGVGHL
jgi:hypothetical protein